jgi:nicotinamidase/pyrazinamidase
MKTHLLIIDPQVDFCAPQGALFVKGADRDITRLAAFVRQHGPALADIHVTLDSHQLVHVAHPIFWIDRDGNHPAPFTVITKADVEGKDPKWKTTSPALRQRGTDYIKALAAGGRYMLVIWPPHCLIGRPGHAIMPELADALETWQQRLRLVRYVTKGSNPLTEHYSAVKADVPDPLDPGTQINTQLIETLQEADRILIAGEALSHCVANTVRDIAAEFGEDQIKKLVLLEDAASSVGGFEKLGEEFVREMVGRGMTVATTANAL